MCDESERTCYVTNLHEQVTQSILEEMFIQMGPVEKVILNFKRGYRYSLVIFKDPESVIFASQCLDKIPLYGMEISVRPKGHSEQEKKYKDLLAKAAREKQNSLTCPAATHSSNSDRREKRSKNVKEVYSITPCSSRQYPRYETGVGFRLKLMLSQPLCESQFLKKKITGYQGPRHGRSSVNYRPVHRNSREEFFRQTFFR
ncbi:unnamed protein product [Enterobius vermicularis]|uniref:RRM domain-containing protein n=1 Tax=Enterobius vermicularis TaxID=51028 RepID=A0A0N4UY72_ENTVE|nr:unnamed protein product [Enterobius vermicularis]